MISIIIVAFSIAIYLICRAVLKPPVCEICKKVLQMDEILDESNEEFCYICFDCKKIKNEKNEKNI
jgi:hypothetical protein